MRRAVRAHLHSHRRLGEQVVMTQRDCASQPPLAATMMQCGPLCA